MRRLSLAVVILACALGRTAAAQVFVGDSVRVRSTVAPTWLYGKLVADAPQQLLVRSVGGVHAVDAASLLRVDRWERTSRPKFMALAVTAGIASGALAYLLEPSTQHQVGDGCLITSSESICRSHAETTKRGSMLTFDSIGAGSGAILGAIGLALHPGRWRVVLYR